VTGGFMLLSYTASESFGQGQFGASARTDAASQMIVLGVQQGISSLPPTSGQSLTYQFDPELSTFVASEQLGPTAFRSPQTVGKGKWAFRTSYSYFELEEEFDPIDYLVTFDDLQRNPSNGELEELVAVSAFGQKVKATVNLVNVGVNYGLLDRLELMFNIPISVIDAQASQISAVRESSVGVPLEDAQAGAVGAFYPPGQVTQADIDGLQDEFGFLSSPACDSSSALDPGLECIRFRSDAYDSFPSGSGVDFNSDTSAGVGRISLGAKYLFYAGEYANVAASFEFFNPSPSQDEFAGSDSPAILPRLIFELPGRFRKDDYFRLHADLGYDYDFESAELRRIVWNTGASVPITRWVTIDFGVGGSEFEKGIRWTPPTASGTNPDVTLTALGDTRLGTSFVDFLGGFKVRLTDGLVLSGSATTPLNSQGFRADAVGTVALEVYL
jgi:hypothetical protein